MNVHGIVIAAICFLCIGIFHPIVIKAEYYFSAKCWPFFLLCGTLFLLLSARLQGIYVSSAFGITGCSCLWSILELWEQEQRVKKGWFPQNPHKEKMLYIFAKRRKRIKTALRMSIGMVAVILLSACGAENALESSATETTEQISENTTTDAAETEATIMEEDRILVAYFSWADNTVIDDVDAISSASVLAPGNVAQLASWVQEETGGDLFSIQVTEPYPSDWDSCLDRANEERSENVRPELKEQVEQIEKYDVVFLGYPNWWYGAPMALLSFIEENDLSGKQIYLFCSHGTGGLAGSVGDIEEALPETAVLSERVFDVYEDDASSAQGDILTWLSEIGF